MLLSNKVKKEIICILTTILSATISFVSLHVFVIPSNFSPSGIDGISTILYEITNINIGWFKFAINLPLFILAWIFLSKRYVFYVCLFTILDSFGVIFLEQIGFFTFIPEGLTVGEELGYRLISAIFSGVALGLSIGNMLKINCSSGGVDIIASLINLKKPHFNIERIISIICYIIILCSYFVYRDIISILLSAIQIFMFEITAAFILRSDRYANEVKIITKTPENIRNEIITNYNHSATILKAKGMFSDEDYYMVITVLDNKSIIKLIDMMKQYPDTFFYCSDGIKVYGDFYSENNFY